MTSSRVLTRRLFCCSCCRMARVASGTSRSVRAASSRFNDLVDQSQPVSFPHTHARLPLAGVLPTHLGREYLANQRRASFREAEPSWYHVCWHSGPSPNNMIGSPSARRPAFTSVSSVDTVICRARRRCSKAASASCCRSLTRSSRSRVSPARHRGKRSLTHTSLTR
ncbi:hypothetical protein EYF80_040800 [Liparis tanakae]|uniref:Uncharacterized protein n=1 Tax=Liparis tanakae TaxID=230148 RepID=A0A4Z2G7R7_9TELE|nr:hypothetical protein EYF80_040800 [Liparis tanakae]